MSIPSLFNTYIDETYQRLVQVTGSGTEFADGLGNSLPIVTQIIAGNGITISPLVGTGSVTINSTAAAYNTATGSYGSFYDTGSQAATSATAIYSMSLSTTDISNGVFISGSDKSIIKFTNAGVYNIQFSAQFSNTSADPVDVTIWLRKNDGSSINDLADTAGITAIPAKKNNNTPGQIISSWNYYVSLANNDFLQLLWHANAANAITLETLPSGSNPVHPRVPSLIVTAQRVDTFLSNTGSFSGSFNGVFTGSLQGTASWANNALTASNILGGTDGYIPLWSGSNTLTSSYLYQSESILKTKSGSIEEGIYLNFSESIHTFGSVGGSVTIYSNPPYYSAGGVNIVGYDYVNINGAGNVNITADYTSIYSSYSGLSTDLDGKVTLYAGEYPYGIKTNLILAGGDYYGNYLKTQYSGSDKGLNLDFANNVYKFGDYGNLVSGSSITIDDIAKTIAITGSVLLTGDLIPAGPYTNNTSSYSLGSPTAAWKDLYVSNGSVYFITGSVSASIQLQNGSITFTGAPVTLPSQSITPTASYIDPLFISQSAAYYGFGGGGGPVDLGGYLTTSSFNSYTGSSTSQFAGTASFASTASYVKNAQTASYVTGTNVAGNITGNASNITAYTINQNLGTTSQVTFGGVTASLQGTASWAQSASNAINAQTASYINNLSQSVQITNNIGTSAALNLFGTSMFGIGTNFDFLRVQNQNAGVPNPWKFFRINNSGSLDILNSGYSNILFTLTDSGSLTLASGVTASLQGTASWAYSASNAVNAQTASFLPVATYQVTSSWAVSSSFATTASYAANGGVTQISAGSGILVNGGSGPATGNITISATGGGSGAGANITASFTNQSTWTFTHGLGNRGVVVQTYDTNWNQTIPQNIVLTDSNTATITFPTSESGYAIATLGGVTNNAATASFASTASYINALNQVVTIGITNDTSSADSTYESMLRVYPSTSTPGTGEGGQIMLAASGGLGSTYSSASFIDNYQDQFRILKGSNLSGSNAGALSINLRTLGAKFEGSVTASGYSGLPNDYLYAVRATSNQSIGSGTWASRDIIFNSAPVSKGISYDTSTGIASLTGGKVYRITATLSWSAGGIYTLTWGCYDNSNTLISNTAESIQPTNTAHNTGNNTLDFIYAPVSNISIKIRTNSDNNALTGESIRYDRPTYFIIQQIA